MRLTGNTLNPNYRYLNPIGFLCATIHHKLYFMIRQIIYLFTLASMLLPIAGMAQKVPSMPKKEISVIPAPKSVKFEQGDLKVADLTQIRMPLQADSAMEATLTFCAEYIKLTTGRDLPIRRGGFKGRNAIIIAARTDSMAVKPENAGAYSLHVMGSQVYIKAADNAGIFYAFQTLAQLMPKGFIPNMKIEDAPRFRYRGLHLDVGRHFFPVDFIKKYIDMMAMYKLNYFHWHLTEDQGWRIEIKKYPKLQEVAAYRKETLVGHGRDRPRKYDGTRYGGYYTQNEIRDVVKYAADRFIIIVPEIEMPGHAQAAVAAYPELGCTGKNIDVATDWGVFEDVYCPNEATFTFLENVLLEVIELFPGPYIHIGGDECPKVQWKSNAYCQELIKKEGLKDEHGLQSYFIKRIEKFLNSKGKRIIGWDEILEGGLAPNATVMSWRGEKGGIEAAKSGHDVIMTPTDNCYLDYYQALGKNEPLAIGGYLPIEKVYNYEPLPAALTEKESKYVLGAQGNVWTEYMPTPQQVEYMVFPRALALAEVLWSPKASRNYKDFGRRLGVHLPRLKKAGVNVSNHIYDTQINIQSGDGKGVFVECINPAGLGVVRYDDGGKTPTAKGILYNSPLKIEGFMDVQAQTFVNDESVGDPAAVSFQWHLAAGKLITLTTPPSPKYGAGGKGALVNAVMGSEERFGDKEWLGFEGKDFEAVIDLGETTGVKEVVLRFYNDDGAWIYPPKQASVAVSADGKSYEQAVVKEVPAGGTDKVINLKISLSGKSGRYLKVKAQNLGAIPAGKEGAGSPPWLFVDEIVVH